MNIKIQILAGIGVRLRPTESVVCIDRSLSGRLH